MSSASWSTGCRRWMASPRSRSIGQRRFAIRIWLDRRALAARNLTIDDIESALRRNNVELPAGELKSTSRQFTVRAHSRLSEVEQFENIVIDRIDGYPIRLGDVARVERGVEDEDTIVRSDGREAVGLGVQRQSQANTIAISNRVRAQLDLIRPTLPDGMEIEHQLRRRGVHQTSRSTRW